MTDYFAFFDLPASPTLDAAELKRRYYANSRKYHPDFHTLADDTAQREVLERSTLNNQGYETLRDPDTRLRHLLEVKEMLSKEGENEVPQDFLMEIMEVNEALMELEFEDDPAVRQKVTGLVDQLEADLERDIRPALDDYQGSDAQLTQLKEYYLKRRYLTRLRQKI